MVELAEGAYDYDGIPFVSASVVSIDAELSDDTVVTAEAIASSPLSSITNSARYPSVGESPIPESESLSNLSRDSSEVVSNDGDEQNPEQTHAERREGQRAVGAGAAGAVLGLLVGGPLLSLILGFGTAYYTKQEGAAGDVARALGEVALVARDKWREVDSKHHLVDKGREAANEAIQRIKQADQRHHGRDKFVKFAAYCWKTTLEFVERHHLIERGCEKLKVLVEQCAAKMQEHQHQVRNCSCHNHGPHHHCQHCHRQ